MEDLIGSILGWVGTIGTFSAYVLLWRGWVSSDALHYSLLNTVGGLMAGAGAFAYGAWPAMASNGLWALIGFHGVITALRRRSMKPQLTDTSVLGILTTPITTPYYTAPAIPVSTWELPSAAVEEATISTESYGTSTADEVLDGGAWNPSVTHATAIELPWLPQQNRATHSGHSADVRILDTQNVAC